MRKKHLLHYRYNKSKS